MIICKECGVALDDKMQACPLCETPVSKDRSEPVTPTRGKEEDKPDAKRNYLLSQVLRQIASILLLSGIAATVVINVAIDGKITWSVYPITICLVVLAYVSVISIWRRGIVFQLAGGWILSGIVLIIVDSLITAEWPLMLAFPILCAVNIVALVLSYMLRTLTTKGLNVFALFILAIAILCLVIEGILSYYSENVIRVQWSAIVAACLVPVTTTILFMHLRTRNNSDLKKIFHR